MENRAIEIRTLVTAIAIAQYQLIALGDNIDADLIRRVKNAISSCKSVEKYFTKNHKYTPETRETFKQEFLSGEILLLSELLKTCFSLPEESIEDIINAVKQNIQN